MKALIWALVPLILLAMPLAFAEEANDTEVTSPPEGNETVEVPEEMLGDPGITPDSPLWGIDVALDKLQLNFAKGPDKANLGLQIAEERLLEIQAMAKKGAEDAATKAEEEHGKVLDAVKDAVEDLNETEVSNETLRGIELGMANHVAALEKVRARILASEKLSEEVRTKLLAKIDGLETKADELITKIESKRLQKELVTETKSKEHNETKEDSEDLNETEDEQEDDSSDENETEEDLEDLEDKDKGKGKPEDLDEEDNETESE